MLTKLIDRRAGTSPTVAALTGWALPVLLTGFGNPHLMRLHAVHPSDQP